MDAWSQDGVTAAAAGKRPGVRLPPRWDLYSVAVAAVLCLHTALLAWSATRHSPVVCETAHLPAGLSHLELRRFDLYRVNPPLVRTIAAFPALLAGANTDWSRYDASPKRRVEFLVGEDFLRANDARSLWLFTLGRWACIPLSLVGGCACFLWANALYGRPAGLMALVLWCFNPTVLGHGALLTPDVGAAALGVAACLANWLWLRRATWQTAFVAGVVLGFAQLAKTTLVVLYLALPVIWLVWSMSRASAARRPSFAQLAMLMGTSFVVINLGYGFEGSFRRLNSYEFESKLFASVADGQSNHFAAWFSDIPVPLPANYVQGMDTQRVDFERQIRSYLRGEWQQGGWWYFYVYAFLVKEPLGLLALVLVACALAWQSPRYRAERGDELAVLLPALAVLMLVSSQTGFSLHPRYVLPALPLAIVATSRVARSFQTSQRRVAILVLAALTWSVSSSLWSYPHNLSYFNELVGGPRRGHQHLADSATAWGQDLVFLREWLADHPAAQDVAVAAFGYTNPQLLDVRFILPPVGPAERAPPAAELAALGPRPGWFAVDVNHLMASPQPVIDPSGRQVQLTNESANFSYFRHFRPVARAGYSILIYRIALEDANKIRRQLGLSAIRPPDVPPIEAGVLLRQAAM